jgi:RNA polymerase sigma factor (sigma-70 family)
MTPDSELLRQFARTNSQDAFGELVKRHVNLVYSAAFRQANGDEHLAKDVAQTVFTDLARKANSLSRRENLTGWLYTSAHFAAAKIVRGENRRRDREEKFMREPINETAPDASRAETSAEAGWEKIRPALDDAMHELKESDRDAILLRYFENRQFAEVGAKLGLNENAARMRVERALEKLRAVFVKRGITTASALASIISANAVQLAPANLAATLTTTSIATAGTGTFTILKIMTATKLKLAFSAIVVAGAATAFVHQQQTQNKLRAQNESLQQQIAQLQTDNGNFSNRLANISGSKKLSEEQFNELLKLRGEVGVLRRQLDELEKVREENQRLRAQNAIRSQGIEVSEKDYFRLHQMDTVSAAKQIGLAMLMYADDNNGLYPTNLFQLTEDTGHGEGYLGATNFTEFVGGVRLDGFELLNVGVSNAHDKYPQMIMLREKTPRQNPNGELERVYGLADGSVQTATSRNGNFGAWERQNTSPPPNQNQ